MSGMRQEILGFTKDEIIKLKETIKKELDFYWSADDDDYLINHYHTGLTTAEVNDIANRLGKTSGAIHARIARLKLSTRSWTKETVDWLQANYNSLGRKACAEHLGRTESAVEHKVNRLGISDRA